MITNCKSCRYKFRLEITRKWIGNGIADVGFYCPVCKHWYHSYYTNKQLDQKRKRVQKLSKKAGRSEQDWLNYKQAKTELQQLHDRLQ